MEKINALIRWAEDNLLKFASMLFLFHLALSSVLYAIACSPYLANMHNADGLWNFSMDSHLFHRWAIHEMKMLQAGDISGWWKGEGAWRRYPHVKWIGLCYFLLTPHPIAFAPVNALTWVATVFTVYALGRLLIPDSRILAALGAAIFSLTPTYLLQTTQLLRDPLYILGVGLFLLGAVRLLKGMLQWPTLVLAVGGMLLVGLLRQYMLPALAVLAFVIMLVAVARVPKSRLLVAPILAVLLGAVCWNLPLIRQALHVPSAAAHHAPLDVAQQLNGVARSLQKVRDGFYDYKAGSDIDKKVVFQGWTDVLRYMPRALQIGLLSPFPSYWIRPDSSSAWRGALLLAGMETAVHYLLILGFVVFACCGAVPLRLRLCLLVFSFSLILLLAMAVPNVGVIYRMRYAYLMPIIVGGVCGWRILLSHSRFSLFHLRKPMHDSNT